MSLRSRQLTAALLGLFLLLSRLAVADEKESETFNYCVRNELVSSLRPKPRSWGIAGALQATLIGSLIYLGRSQTTQPSPLPAQVSSQKEEKTPEQEELETGAPLKSEAQVLADAQYDLRYWKTNHEARTDMGKFCIDSEILDLTPDEAWAERKAGVEEHTQRLAHIRKIAGDKPLGMPELQAIRAYLLREEMPIFKRDNARLIDFDIDAGGNSEAQTKLVISTLIDSKNQLQPPLQLGIQRFSDRIQPVIYDATKNTVYELVSGRTVHGVQGNIYSPELIQYAFVNGRGKKPDIDLTGDLLIVKEDSSLVHHFKFAQARGSNSKSVWPDASGVWKDGKPGPRMAVMQELGSAGKPGGDGGQASEGPPPSPLVLCPGNQRDEDGKKVGIRPSKLPYDMYRQYDPVVNRNNICILSNDPAFLRGYRQLNNRKDRIDYIENVTQQAFLDVSDTPDFRMLTAFLRDPQRAEKMSAEDFQRVVSAEKQIVDLRNRASEIPAYIQAFMEIDETHLYPVLKTWTHDVRLFGQRLAENPKSWLAWADALPSESQLGFFSVVSHVDSAYTDGTLKNYKSFLNWASKPGNVEVISDSEATQTRAHQIQALAKTDQEKAADAQMPVLLWFTWGNKIESSKGRNPAFVSSPFLQSEKKTGSGMEDQAVTAHNPDRIKISETTLERLSTSFFDGDATPGSNWTKDVRMYLNLMKLWTPSTVRAFISDRKYVEGLDETEKGLREDFIFGPPSFGYFEDAIGPTETARLMSGMQTVTVVHDSSYVPTDFDNNSGHDHRHVLAQKYPAFLQPLIDEMNKRRTKDQKLRSS
jgi:hypothetical protein